MKMKSLFIVITLLTAVMIGCTENTSVEPGSDARGSVNKDTGTVKMELGKEMVIPVHNVGSDKAGGGLTDGQIHNNIVSEYHATYGSDKAAADYATIAARVEVLAQSYGYVPASSLESLLEFMDLANYNTNASIVANYNWHQLDSAAQTYWHGLFDEIEGLESGAEIEAAVIAYGAIHGFPQNKPYTGALNILLHSSEYWDTYESDGWWDRLRRGSQVIASDAVGGIMGGLAGAGLGFIGGGPVGSVIGGAIGGPVGAATASIAANELLPE